MVAVVIGLALHADVALAALSSHELNCQRAIGRQARQFASLRHDALVRCNNELAQGAACNRELTQSHLDHAEETLNREVSVESRCMPPRVALEALGFPGRCVDLDGPSFSLVNLAKCIVSSHEREVDAFIAIEFREDLDERSLDPEEGQCQTAIGREAKRFAAGNLRTRTRCLDRQLKRGRAAVDCRALGTETGDRSTDKAIKKLVGRLTANLEKRCLGVGLSELGPAARCPMTPGRPFGVAELAACVVETHERGTVEMLSFSYPFGLPPPTPAPSFTPTATRSEPGTTPEPTEPAERTATPIRTQTPIPTPTVTPGCGNATLESGEQCDPPGSSGSCPPGTACTSTCSCPPPVEGLQIAVTSPPDGSVVAASPLTIGGTVSQESALVQIESSLARVNGFAFSAPGVTLVEGPNILIARATNRDGNSVQVSHRLVLDSTPPVIEVLTPVDRSFAGSAAAPLFATVHDVSKVRCDIDGRSVQVDGAVPTFQVRSTEGLAEGQNVLVITCVDAVGHTSSRSVTVNFDSSLLRVTSVTPRPGAAGVARETRVTVSFSEPIAADSIRPETFFLTAGGIVLSGSILTDAQSATFVPAVLPPGQEIRVHVTTGVRDVSGNPLSVAFASAFFTRGSASEPGAVFGEVYDDTRSLPIGAAVIEVIDASTSSSLGSLVSSARGQFLLPPNVEHLLVRVTKEGFTAADRELVTTGAVFTELLDARLTPLREPVSVEGRLGGTITTDLGDRLDIPPGAFSGTAAVRFTSISEQGPQGPFPPGWAPIGIGDLRTPASFSALPAIQFVDRSGAAADREAVAARYDDVQRRWVAIEVVTVGSAGAAVTVADRPGQYAVLIADGDPGGPGSAVIGEPLPEAAPGTFPADAEATGKVEPSQGRVDDPSAVRASVLVTANDPIRSGTPLRGDFMERFILAAGGSFAPAGNSQDLVTYRAIGDPSGNTARATFAIAPSRSFSLTEATSGLITVDLAEGQPMDRTLVSNGGGVIIDDGSRLGVPAGAFNTAVPVSLRRVPSNGFPTEIPDGFSFVGAFDVDLVGQVANEPLSIALESPEVDVRTGEQVVVARVLNVLDRERLVIVALGRVLGSSIVTETVVGNVEFPGIVEGGRYLFLSFPGSLVPVAGTVRHADGTLAGHVVEIFDVPLVGISDEAGHFVVLARPGTFTLIATGGHVRDEVRVEGHTQAPVDEVVIAPSGPRVVRLEVRPPPIQGAVAGPVVLLGKPAPIVDDDNLDGTLGNGDGIVAAGERIALTLTVQNQGNRTAPAGFFVLDIVTPTGRIETTPVTFAVEPLPPEIPIEVGPFVFEVPAGSDSASFTYDLIYEIDGSQVGQSSLRGNEVPFPLPLGVEHHQVSLGSEITVTFSEPVAITAVRAGAQLVREDNGQAVAITVVATEDPKTFKLRPTQLLDDSTIYRVTLSPAIVDADGRSLSDSPYSERIRTVDRTAPPQIEPGKIEATAPNAQGIVVITGGPGSVNPTDVVIVINETTGLTVLAAVALDGSFRGEIRADIDDLLSLIVRDQSDNETRIPIRTLVRRDPTSGDVIGAIIGTDGGVLELPDGTSLIVPTGAVAAPTDFRLVAVDTPISLPPDLIGNPEVASAFGAAFRPVATIRLDASVARFQQPVDVSIPAPAGTALGDLFVVARTVTVELAGLTADLDRKTGTKAATTPRVVVQRMQVIESATAKMDGSALVVSTDSPPFPGITEPSTLVILKVAQPVLFVHGSVVRQETGRPVRDAAVTSAAAATAPFVAVSNREGTYILPDATLGGDHPVGTALSVRLSVSDPLKRRTVTDAVAGTIAANSPPETTVLAAGPFALPEKLPPEFIDILGDLEDPTVSIRIDGEGLDGVFAKIGVPLTVTVEADDNDRIDALSLAIDQGSGFSPAGLSAARTFELVPESSAVITLRAEARDPSGNTAISEERIRSVVETSGAPPGSLPGQRPVVMVPPKTSDSPVAEEDQIAFDKGISVPFSEPLDPNTVSEQTVILRDPENNAVPAVIGMAKGDTRVSISPKRHLRLGACYSVEFSSELRDLNGEPYGGEPLVLTVPAPVQVATVAEPNTRDLSPLGEILVAGSYPNGEDPSDNGTLSTYQLRNEDGLLLARPIRLGAIETRGQPLSLALDGSLAFVANKFLGPIASMRAVLNPSFFLPGLGGVGGLGNIGQCASNPLLCFGVSLVWESFPIPPSNLQAIDLTDPTNPIEAGIEELNRIKVNIAENASLSEDFFALNVPGLWGPNTWPIKTTITPHGVALVNSHMNLEFFTRNTGDDLTELGRIERIMGVGQRLGRCVGGSFAGSVCTISWLSFRTDGSEECGGSACEATLDFRDATFLDNIAVSTEETGLRLVQIPQDRNRRDHTIQAVGTAAGVLPWDNAPDSTLANAQRFSWEDGDGEMQVSDLVFVESAGSGLKVLDVTDPSEPFERGSLPQASGVMAVDECRGLLYLHDAEEFHVVDFNNPDHLVELNDPGATGTAFRVEGLANFNLARISQVDGNVFLGGRQGFSVVATKRCTQLTKGCEPQIVPDELHTFDTGCRREELGVSEGIPVRKACLDYGIVPAEEIEVAADQPSISLSASIFIPDPENPGQRIAAENGSLVRWEILEGAGGAIDVTPSETVNGVSTVTLYTTTRPGDSFVVRASLERLRYRSTDDGEVKEVRVFGSDLQTKRITVVPGRAATVEMVRSKPGFAADETDTISFTATVRDAVGNFVADGTPVLWSLDGLGGIDSTQTTQTISDGEVHAVVQAGFLAAPQKLTLRVDDLARVESISVSPIQITLTSDRDELGLEGGQVANLTATFRANNGQPVADGTRVQWTTSSGYIAGDSVVTNGQASAKLLAAGGALGRQLVRVSATSFADHLIIPFTSDNELRVSVPVPYVAGDVTEDGSLAVEQGDGSMRQIAYKTSAIMNVAGPPGAVLRVRSSGFGPISSYAFDMAVDDVVPDEIADNDLVLSGAVVTTEDQISGEGALSLSPGATALIRADSSLEVAEGLATSFWLRPSAPLGGQIVEFPGGFDLRLASDGLLELEIGGTVLRTNTPVVAGEWHNVSFTIAPRGATLRLRGAAIDEEVSVPLDQGIIGSAGDVVIGGELTALIDDLSFAAIQKRSSLLALFKIDDAGQVQPLPSGETKLDDQGKAKLLVKSTGRLNESLTAFGAPVSFDISAAVEGREPHQQPLPIETKVLVARVETLVDAVNVISNTIDAVAAGIVTGDCVAGDSWCENAALVSSLFPPTAAYATVRDFGVLIARAAGLSSNKEPVRWWEWGAALAGPITKIFKGAARGAKAFGAFGRSVDPIVSARAADKLADAAKGGSGALAKHSDETSDLFRRTASLPDDLKDATRNVGRDPAVARHMEEAARLVDSDEEFLALSGALKRIPGEKHEAFLAVRNKLKTQLDKESFDALRAAGLVDGEGLAYIAESAVRLEARVGSIKGRGVVEVLSDLLGKPAIYEESTKVAGRFPLTQKGLGEALDDLSRQQPPPEGFDDFLKGVLENFEGDLRKGSFGGSFGKLAEIPLAHRMSKIRIDGIPGVPRVDFAPRAWDKGYKTDAILTFPEGRRFALQLVAGPEAFSKKIGAKGFDAHVAAAASLSDKEGIEELLLVVPEVLTVGPRRQEFLRPMLEAQKLAKGKFNFLAF